MSGAGPDRSDSDCLKGVAGQQTHTKCLTRTWGGGGSCRVGLCLDWVLWWRRVFALFSARSKFFDPKLTHQKVPPSPPPWGVWLVPDLGPTTPQIGLFFWLKKAHTTLGHDLASGSVRTRGCHLVALAMASPRLFLRPRFHPVSGIKNGVPPCQFAPPPPDWLLALVYWLIQRAASFCQSIRAVFHYQSLR